LHTIPRANYFCGRQKTTGQEHFPVVIGVNYNTNAMFGKHVHPNRPQQNFVAGNDLRRKIRGILWAALIWRRDIVMIHESARRIGTASLGFPAAALPPAGAARGGEYRRAARRFRPGSPERERERLPIHNKLI
jgi:hypothetical protein